MIQDGREKKEKIDKVVLGGKACLNSQVFSWLLKIPSKGAMRISKGRLFQRQGATAEKAQFLALSLRASLGVRLLSRTY